MFERLSAINRSDSNFATALIGQRLIRNSNAENPPDGFSSTHASDVQLPREYTTGYRCDRTQCFDRRKCSTRLYGRVAGSPICMSLKR